MREIGQVFTTAVLAARLRSVRLRWYNLLWQRLRRSVAPIRGGDGLGFVLAEDTLSSKQELSVG